MVAPLKLHFKFFLDEMMLYLIVRLLLYALVLIMSSNILYAVNGDNSNHSSVTAVQYVAEMCLND